MIEQEDIDFVKTNKIIEGRERMYEILEALTEISFKRSKNNFSAVKDLVEYKMKFDMQTAAINSTKGLLQLYLSQSLTDANLVKALDKIEEEMERIKKQEEFQASRRARFGDR